MGLGALQLSVAVYIQYFVQYKYILSTRPVCQWCRPQGNVRHFNDWDEGEVATLDTVNTQHTDGRWGKWLANRLVKDLFSTCDDYSPPAWSKIGLAVMCTMCSVWLSRLLLFSLWSDLFYRWSYWILWNHVVVLWFNHSSSWQAISCSPALWSQAGSG